MIWTAFKMLTGDRGKFLGIVFGVTFAAMLIAQQMSMFCGIMQLTTSQIRDVEGADLWVMDRDVLSIDDFKPMNDTILQRIRGARGVRWAVPFFRSVVQAKMTSSGSGIGESPDPDAGLATYKRVVGAAVPRAMKELPTISNALVLLGVDDDSLVGAPGPAKILIADNSLRDLLRKPDAIVLDKYSCELLWREESKDLHRLEDYRRFVGRTFEINEHRAVVAGICQASKSFQTLPIAYTTFSRAKQFVPGGNKTIPFVLVKAEDNVPLGDVSRNIAAKSHYLVKARTQDDFLWDTVWYNMTRTGIPINFGLTVLLGFVVGTAIAGQTFYQFTLENLKQFGALKAMGTSNRTILGMILMQGMTVGPIGYGLGVGLAAAFGKAMANNPKIAYFMPWQVLAITGIAVLAICVLASILSIRRALVLEPAIVFRG
jgi:putative ABC transport system permease protein